MARTLDGESLAREIRAHLRQRMNGLSRAPSLLLVRVGEDPASAVYVRNKEKAATEVGIDSRVEVYPESLEEAALLRRLAEANADPAIDAILVQLPLPPHLRAEPVVDAIDPGKDADGLHPLNQGLLALGRPRVLPCTPAGVLALLHRHQVPLAGRHVVVLGRSSIVGRPLSILLSLKAAWADATVTLCHSRTPDWPAIARTGDVVVAAMGRPRAVGADAIAPGAAVVDVGIHRVPDPQRPGKTRLAGDVDEASVAPVAGYLSPVPGGVGPLTVAMLLANTVQARERADRLTRPPVWEEVTGKEQEAGPGTSWGREPA